MTWRQYLGSQHLAHPCGKVLVAKIAKSDLQVPRPHRGVWMGFALTGEAGVAQRLKHALPKTLILSDTIHLGKPFLFYSFLFFSFLFCFQPMRKITKDSMSPEHTLMCHCGCQSPQTLPMLLIFKTNLLIEVLTAFKLSLQGDCVLINPQKQSMMYLFQVSG